MRTSHPDLTKGAPGDPWIIQVHTISFLKTRFKPFFHIVTNCSKFPTHNISYWYLKMGFINDFLYKKIYHSIAAHFIA